MSEDYLWDKSGDPDDDIDQLEKLFHEVKFDANAAPMPQFRPIANTRSRRFWIPATIAASIAFLLVTGTFVFKKWNGSRAVLSGPLTSALPTDSVNPQVATVPPTTKEVTQYPVSVTPSKLVAKITRERPTPRSARFTKSPLKLESERERGERAKADLMLALHIAGSKLNMVQQKLAVNKEAGPSS